jgi:hypothetical protein
LAGPAVSRRQRGETSLVLERALEKGATGAFHPSDLFGAAAFRCEALAAAVGDPLRTFRGAVVGAISPSLEGPSGCRLDLALAFLDIAIPAPNSDREVNAIEPIIEKPITERDLITCERRAHRLAARVAGLVRDGNHIGVFVGR